MTNLPTTPVFSTKNQRVQVGMLATSLQIGEAPAGGAFEASSTLIVNKDQTGDFTKFTTSSPTNIVGPQPTETITFSWPENPVAFEPDPVGETANVVLINDNVNKIPRDLSEVGPNDKTFRSSVRLFARVNNNESNDNTQWYPGTSSDTASIISNASDSNFIQKSIPDFERQGVYQLDANPLICRISVIDSYETTATNTRVFSDITGSDIMTFATAPSPAIIPGMMIAWSNQNTTFLGAEGDVFNEGTIFGVVTAVNSPTEIVTKLAIVVQYQNAILRFVHTKGYPLCAGPPRPKGTGFASWNFMQPTLAVFETDPVESLLDIFWETDTVGLINDLNNLISSTFTGAVGWSSNFSWVQPESLTSGGNISTGIFPVDSIGTNLTTTRLVDSNNNIVNSIAATNVNGSTVGIILQPTLPYTDVAWDGSYKITTTSDFVFLNDVNTRNFTIVSIIRNGPLSTDETSSPLTQNGSLTNVAPSFVIPTNPLVISGTATGVVTTYLDTSSTSSRTSNGSISATNDQAQLKWSIVAGGTGDLFFSINENTGALTKIVSSVLAGTYTLNIKLEDTWNGTSSSPDAKNLTLVQNITINNSTSGFQFEASPPGTYSQSCSVLPRNPLCGDNFYYNTTRASATPQVGDVIRQGPGNNAPFAPEGTYSYNCGQDGQNNRHYFQIVKLFGESDDGVVDVVDVC